MISKEVFVFMLREIGNYARKEGIVHERLVFCSLLKKRHLQALLRVYDLKKTDI